MTQGVVLQLHILNRVASQACPSQPALQPPPSPPPPPHRLLADDVNSVPWHLAMFDEAHKLKNDRTKLYEAVAGLPTRLRYGLTGTPMQNDYQELWWGGGGGVVGVGGVRGLGVGWSACCRVYGQC